MTRIWHSTTVLKIVAGPLFCQQKQRRYGRVIIIIYRFNHPFLQSPNTEKPN